MYSHSRILLSVVLLAAVASIASAQVSVLTQHNDAARTGRNLNETVLTTASVNVSNFGKLFWRTVDGYIYAQPLYVSNLTLGGKTRNVVFVATEHNSVYAFDADDPNGPAPLWHVNLGTPVPSNDVCVAVSSCPYDDLQPEIGITATPAIDLVSQTLYVVSHTKNTSNDTYHFWLHALDLLSGNDKFGPTEITASGFNPLFHLNRPGLLLLNGVVYVAFGSAGDFGDWHGYVMSFDASTLAQLGTAFNSTPGDKVFVPGEQGGGGIFSCGQGLVTDGTYLYFFTGNGPFDVNSGGQDYGDSAIKLSASNLSLLDYFAPNDALTLGQNNVDLGAGGPILLPGTNLLVGGGKDGLLRVLDTSNMGRFNTTDQVVQEWQATNAWIMGSPIYWNSPNFGPVIYLWASGDLLKTWQFNGQTFSQTPVSQGAVHSASGESDTSPLSLSANQSQAGTGIVWAPVSLKGDPNKKSVPGILHAFDATNLGDELWNSQQNSVRDGVGSFAKFNPPTIANGKVYLGTFSGQLLVYGLNPPPASGINFVQEADLESSALTSLIKVPLSLSEQSGDLNVVVVGWADTTSQVSSITDSQGNAYQLAVGPTKSSSSQGTNLTQSIYYAKDIAGGSNAVTVTFNQGANAPDVRVLEYSGVDTISPLDVTSTATGRGTFASSGSKTTNSANELIFGANTVEGATTYPGSPFISRVITQPNADLAEDRMVNVADSYSAGSSVSSGNWVMQMATFKAASSSAIASFRVDALPVSNTVKPGQSASYTVTVTPQNGFSGAVSLSCSGLPAQATCSFSPSSLSGGGTSSLTVATTTATPIGTYHLVITGTSGSLQDSASVTLTVGPDFSIAVSPASQSVSPGKSTTYTVSVTAQNGFSGKVSLSCAGLPAQTTCAFNPATVASSGQSSLTISTGAGTPSGSYAVTVAGTSGSVQNFTSAALTVSSVPGFALSLSPSSASVAAGAAATYTISVSSQNGFSDPVTLSCSGLPAGAACAFTPTSVPMDTHASLTIATTGPTAQLLPRSGRTAPGPLYALGLLFSPLAVISFSRMERKRRFRKWLLSGIVAALLALQLSCGGGGSSTPPGGATPPGSYSIQVTATAQSLQRSTTVTLDVQ